MLLDLNLRRKESILPIPGSADSYLKKPCVGSGINGIISEGSILVKFSWYVVLNKKVFKIKLVSNYTLGKSNG